MSAVAIREAPIRPKPPESKYRPEIDGLRAFAVVAVIINHFNKDLLPSGYLGVDIFFVISGYVITSSLTSRESRNFQDFVAGFYERRIKRLAPALAVFVLITGVLICLFNPEPGAALGIGWRSLFGISNIQLYFNETDYFAQSAELNPFTHTWSLGVEEQFYLLFPFLIWFTGFGQQKANGARNLFLCIGTLTITSLIAFIYLYQVNQPAAYFLMPPRFWEMSAGCLIFIGLQKRERIASRIQNIPPSLVVVAMIGVMLLPIALGVPATVGIVALSAVLMACLKPGTGTYKLFTHQKIVFIGLISYSLYLWHWGILCISRWTIGIHWWSAPIQIGLMILIAIGSYKWIERPLRRSLSPGKLATLMVGLTCLVFSGFIVKAVLGSLKKHLYRGDYYDYYMSSNPESNGEIPFQEDKKPSSRRLVVLGDSHAGHLLSLVREVANKRVWAYKVYATPGKPVPSINGNLVRVDKTSKYQLESMSSQKRGIKLISTRTTRIDVSKEARLALNELKSGDILIISSRHLAMYQKPFIIDGAKFYLDAKDNNNRTMHREARSSAWKRQLQEITKIATMKGAIVVFFSPLPEFESELGTAAMCARGWFRLGHIQTNCGRLLETRETILKTRFFPEMKESLKEIAREYPGFHIFDPFPTLCPANKHFCSSDNDTGRLYSDNDHLSVRGSLLLAKPFEDLMETIISHKQ